MRGTSRLRFGSWGSAALLLLLLAGVPAADDEDRRSPAIPPPGAPFLDLPRVEVPEIPTDDPSPAPLVVTLLPSGDFVFQGTTWPLGTATLEQQRQALAALRDSLRKLTNSPGTREADGSSRIPLVIHADRNARWIYVQWILQVCAGSGLGIYKIRFGVRPAAGRGLAGIPMDLPKDSGLGSPRADDRPRVTVKLIRRGIEDGDPGNDFTRVRVGNDYSFELPPGEWTGISAQDDRRQKLYDEVFEKMAADIRTIRAQIGSPPALVGEILAPRPLGLKVPHGDVMRVLACFHRAGLSEVLLGGTPPPPSEATEPPSYEEHPVPQPAPTGLLGIGGGTGGAFGSRGGEGDATGGGGQRALTAVDDALRWLAAHQSADGGWSAETFGTWCDGKSVTDGPDGAGKVDYDVGVTGLALCAYLGAGYTHRGRHPFAQTIAKGLRYLRSVQDAEGCFGPRTSPYFVYNHAAAALAIVEAYGMTGSPLFHQSAQKALDFIALARNPYFAWRYGVKPGDNDTSITGWMMMALKSAKLINEDAVHRGKPAPLRIDEAAFDGIKAWVEKMTDPATGRTGYLQRGGNPARAMELMDRFPGEKSESMTGVGMLARIFVGEDPRRSRLIKLGADLCAELPPTWNPSDGSIDMYYWYLATLAMFQVGGPKWKAWDRALKKALIPNQRKDTDYCHYQGSWDPLGPWGADGGRVYSTALLAMCLEVYYRYDRLFPAR